MEANELRIGNFVTVENESHHPKLKNETLTVTEIVATLGFKNEKTFSISLKNIKDEDDRYYEEYCQFIWFVKPIPLTEEWLLKLGFEKSGFLYRNDDVIIEYYNNSGFVFLYCSDYGYSSIKYVHQLQNLFFCLCGEELKNPLL